TVRHRRHPRYGQSRADDAGDRPPGRDGDRPRAAARATSPSRRDRQGHAPLGLHDRAGPNRGLHRDGHGRRSRRADADAGDRHADAQLARRSRRHDLGFAQSVRGQRIKLFGPDGNKLSDEIESAIEAALDDGNGRATAAALGRARRLEDAPGRYIEAAKSSFPKGLRLDGVKIVIDCANGAAYKVAPTVMWELGGEIHQIGVSPDGLNINRGCGATHPDTMRQEVVKRGAHIGLALDGDADRLIVADEQGRLLDGDQIMALIALEWRNAGRLAPAGVVSTVMSNLGFERYLAANDIQLTRTAVGDRYVVEEMRRGGATLGGEQSGHIIMSDYATTGDGLISALQVLAALVQRGEPASKIGNQFTPVPQLLRNVEHNGGWP